MSTNRIEIDPSGDTSVILPRNHPSYGCSDSAQLGSSESLGSQPELHFLCSKKHLTLASRRADKIFASGFIEAIPKETDGLHHWKFEAIFDPEAFEIVMKIIHGKTRDIPRTVKLDLLAGISAVVDDLECHDSLWFFAKGWLLSFKNRAPKRMNKELTQLILISFVFDDAVLFETSTKTAITCNTGLVPTFNLPIRPNILWEIEERRENALDKLINGLYDLEQRLLTQELGCNRGCRSIMLGTLIQDMKACSLHSPRPSTPFPSSSLSSAIESLRNFESPKYYSSAQDTPLGKHSGSWRLSSYPSSSKNPGQNIPSGWGFPLDQKDTPQLLVRHHCSLEDLISPLLQAAETEVKGLRLAQYLNL